MLDNKYLLTMMVAKRAKDLKYGDKPLMESKHKLPIVLALEEIMAGKVFIKEKEEPLKDKEIFNDDDEIVKSESLSDDEIPAKTEEIFIGDDKPVRPESLLNEDIK